MGARKSIDAVIGDLAAIAADLHGTADAEAAGIELAITSLRLAARELAAWRRKAQATRHLGLPAQDRERKAADAELAELGVDPNASPADDDIEDDARYVAAL